METTERIVEAYVRHVLGWATISNIRCTGQNEIDLVAIDLATLARYHIEVSISISQGFRTLTGKPFDAVKVKERVHQASQRRTVGFFIERKFDTPSVIERLRKLGFVPGEYTRAIVTWDWDEEAAKQADEAGVVLWDFRTIVQDIAKTIRGSREYFADDTLRTLNLFIHASEGPQKGTTRPIPATKVPDMAQPKAPESGTFWVYENWPNNAATMHMTGCSFCNEGTGMNGSGSTASGQWLGPFERAAEGWTRAMETGRRDVRRCGICLPAERGSVA